jgi:hypothetical protein
MSRWNLSHLTEVKLSVVLDYYEAMETYSRIGLLRSYGNLQSYWTTTKLWELTVLLDYYEAIWEITVVLDWGKAMGTFSRICVRSSRFDSYIRSVAGDVIIGRGENYTRIGCGRWETTLVPSDDKPEDDKPQSKRWREIIFQMKGPLEKMAWRIWVNSPWRPKNLCVRTTLETSGEDE